MAAIIPAVAVGAFVADELPKLFGDTIELAGQGNAIYLRDGEPESLVAKISQAVSRASCRRYDSGTQEYSPEAANRIERTCRPYLDSIGSPGGPGIELPFRGGQCPGVTYNVLFEFRSRVSAQFSCQAFGPWTSSSVIANNGALPIGPILSINQFVETVTSPPGSNRRQEWRVVAANGTFFLNLAGSPSRAYWEACGPAYEVRNIQAVRVGGGVDNCGNPEPIVRVPPPPPLSPVPPVRFNPEPGIDIDIDAEFNFDGSITFDIGTGPITVDLSGGDGGGGDGGGGTDPTAQDPGSPGAGGEAGGDGDGTIQGCAGEGQELVGVQVDVLEAPESANRFFNTPETVYRGAYYCAMGYPGRLGLDLSGGTVEASQFFHAQQRGLTCWRVRANVGYIVRATPYYRTLETSEE